MSGRFDLDRLLQLRSRSLSNSRSVDYGFVGYADVDGLRSGALWLNDDDAAEYVRLYNVFCGEGRELVLEDTVRSQCYS